MTRKAWIIVLLVVLVGAGGLGAFWRLRQQPQALQLPGTVEVQEVRLGSRVGGRVAAAHIREGEVAEPDQVLVTFEAPELEAQREQRQAHVDSMAAALEKMQAGARP